MGKGGVAERGRRRRRGQAGGRRSAQEVPSAQARVSGCSEAAARRTEGEEEEKWSLS